MPKATRGSTSSRDIIKKLEDDGWILKRITGSHHHFTHSVKNGKVTVPHPVKDMPIGTLKNIERQCGIKLR
jgi:predicted RNA binding protein YcfA (HicA-like mRNA interferase family)